MFIYEKTERPNATTDAIAVAKQNVLALKCGWETRQRTLQVRLSGILIFYS